MGQANCPYDPDSRVGGDWVDGWDTAYEYYDEEQEQEEE